VPDGQAKAVGDQLRAELARAAAALTLEVNANLVEACPFRTGHARANFVPSVGEAATSEDDGAAQASGQIAVLGYQLGAPLFIANNVPYIGRLIGGSSTQAAPGWDLAAIDAAVQTVQQLYDGVEIDVSAASGAAMAARGAPAAGNMASAYSPFGGDE
jgi:hypothetical protein